MATDRPEPMPRVVDALRQYIREYWIIPAEAREDGNLVAFVARRFVADGWWFHPVLANDNPTFYAEDLADHIRLAIQELGPLKPGDKMGDVQAFVAVALESKGFRK